MFSPKKDKASHSRMYMKPKALRRRVIRNSLRRRIISSWLMIILGIVSASLGLKGFLLPNGFLDGGITGVSLLINRISGVGVPILIFGINIPFVVLAYFTLSKSFAWRTFVSILIFTLTIKFFSFPSLTNDHLLIAIFGGFFLGLGIGLCIRGGCVLDGTEVLAVYISKVSVFTVGDVLMVFNIGIFTVSALLVNIETAMYAILTYLAASKTVDFVLNGLEEYTAVTVISSFSADIQKMMMNDLHLGVTIYNGKRGYGSRGNTNDYVEIIYTVTTRLEIQKLSTEIQKIDPRAFIIQQSIKDTRGGMIRKRLSH